MGKINDRDAKRIATNANIAISQLKEIIMLSYDLQSEYLKYRLKGIKDCIKFMEEFEND